MTGSSVFVPSIFFIDSYNAHSDLHSFPTRRSSDLVGFEPGGTLHLAPHLTREPNPDECAKLESILNQAVEDRKSTRLNSSHANISYAVFCLKKKKTYRNSSPTAHDTKNRLQNRSTK